ncbi:CHAD domain-containing protein [Nocardioides limicola]|uniref:CHAD domain-containing protein n=1 Tax=Nocardioides limicola TaxID=2803368 RepID=UPI00193C74E7|nr:CHAD domain-containing protein [Nocardioides sp. DJM-14]
MRPLTTTGLLRPWLEQQRRELGEALPQVAVPRQVHVARVRIRRLRSVVSAYRVYLPDEVVDLGPGWQRLARGLSPLRDVDVIAELLRQRGIDEYADHLHRERERRLAEARGAVTHRRTRRLLDAWDAAVTGPDWPAGGWAVEAAEKVTARERARLAKRADSDPHDLRKAAKRARYAAEVVADIYEPAAALAASAQRIQARVGARLDARMLEAWLADKG